jgi:hypothetical protein
MRAATTSAIPKVGPAVAQRRPRSRAATLAGLGIASLFPAIFWSVLIDVVASWLGTPLATRTVTIIGAVIALFLLIVCAPLFLRGSGD